MEPTPYSNYDDAPDGPPVPKRLHAARPWAIVLTALLAELVIIAAIGNQAVSKRFTDYLNDHARTAPDYTVGAFKSLLVFSWRFAPANGQPTHEWAAAFAGIGTLLVLTWLLVWIVARGSVTFPRTWVTVVAIVAAVTPIAAMVRNVIVVPERPGALQSKVGQAIYGYADFGPVIVAGLVLGLVVGLFAALFAVITRRTVELPRVEVPVPAPVNAYGVPDPGYQPPAWGDAPINPAYEDAPTQYAHADSPTQYVHADSPTQYVPPVVPDEPYAPAPEPGVYAPVQAPEAQPEAHEPDPQPEPEPAPPAPTPEPEPASPEPPSAESETQADGEPVEVGEHDMEIATDEFPAVTETIPPVREREQPQA